ncbi:hypothetical protein [Aestuariivirga sp.]|uniref:hypothetical protein n=1 Tax=Aestuariivirga sp. TaxID=2650926 RepID=UPI003BAB136B
MAVFLLLMPAARADQLSLETVKQGREGIELTARLTAEGGPIQRNISWSIRTDDGGTVYESGDGTVDVSLPPGDYVVDASYGATTLTRTVSLPPGTRLKAGIVLDAGGLRIEPLLSGVEVPAVAARIRVYALSGGRLGRLMALSVTPGEVIRLPAGTYRVESQVSSGNVKAVADVHVTAGRVASVKIGHKAGLARLAFVGSPNAKVLWEVEDGSGLSFLTRKGLTANVTLLPGTYTARAEVGAELLTATFNIGAGEIRDIMLGN